MVTPAWRGTLHPDGGARRIRVEKETIRLFLFPLLLARIKGNNYGQKYTFFRGVALCTTIMTDSKEFA